MGEEQGFDSLSERLPVNKIRDKMHMDCGVLRTKCRAKKSLFIESEEDGMYLCIHWSYDYGVSSNDCGTWNSSIKKHGGF